MLIEAEDYWLLALQGEPINRVSLDWQVHLLGYDHPAEVEIAIGCPFRLVLGGEEHQVHPGRVETLAPVLRVFRKPVTAVVAQKDGHLEVRFSDGDRLVVAPHPTDDAWELGLSPGMRIVCLPGGELTTMKAS